MKFLTVQLKRGNYSLEIQNYRRQETLNLS